MLHSGNGSIGATDSAISMLLGPTNSAFGTAFNAGDFAAARAGGQASIISRNGAWIDPSAFSDTTANWISTGPGGASEGGTALFAIDFTITDPSVGFGSIDFDFAVDNVLGTGPNQGLYLNGTALSGGTSFGTFTSEFNITRNDIAGLLVSGLNTLYINSTDVGGPGGLLFSTTITTRPRSTGGGGGDVPEPATTALFAMGLLGLVVVARRRRKN
jgi:hypothetical protein